MSHTNSSAADPHDLARFVEAQEEHYARALAEIRAGRKRSHWMWFIFPQLAGLGSSAMAARFAIRSRAEADAYLHHPILGARLTECAEAALAIPGRSAAEVFGFPDDLKLRSCATLFADVSPPRSVFERLLWRYFGGERDPLTRDLLSPALGLESGVVRLAEYDDRWPLLFSAEAQHIFASCERIPLRLEHIGSTSVAGLCAKPVLDILAGRPAGTTLAPYVACFERAGYDYRGERGVVGREFFRRGEPRAYHVHLVEHEGVLWREHLVFRDYLRAHADAVARYADLKRSLAARFPRDREAYTAGKSAFVQDLIVGALGAG